MTKIGKITQTDTRQINKNRVFRLIYEKKAIARADIADELDLSLPTVNQNIKELYNDGLVDYYGNFQSTGGRKAQAIIVPDYIKNVINISIKKKHIYAVVANVFGDVILSRDYNEEFSTSDNYARILNRIIEDCEKKLGDNVNNILGVGITVPGIIDKDLGKILFAPTLDIKDYDVNELTKYIKYPVNVENDAKAFAYAQVWKNQDKQRKIALLVDRGVGGGLINDKIDNHSAYNGEFGHLIIRPKGRECACGRKGCLEAYVSTVNLSERMGITINEFFENVNSNAYYKTVLNEYLDNLSLGINNIITMYDAPVVIGGEIALYLGRYMEELNARVKEYNADFSKNISLELAEYAKNDGFIGASLKFIEDFIASV